MKKNVKKKYLQPEDFQDFFFGYYWDPNEHIPRGFAHITVSFKKKFFVIYIYISFIC